MKQDTPLQKLLSIKKSELNDLRRYESKSRKTIDKIKGLMSDIEQIKRLLPYEREVIENYGEKMQIVEDVDPYGNVTFVFDPKTHFNQTFKTE
jgi:flagellar biosynthesis chaperone FliJ